MTIDLLREATTSGCLPYERTLPSFAIPLFASARFPDRRLVQAIDEISGRVSGFRALEGADKERGVAVNQLRVSVGDEPLQAFVSESDEAHIGTISELKPFLMACTERYSDNAAIVLQITELVGTDEAKRLARIKMRDCIYSLAGERAAEAFYEGGTLRAALWEVLVSSISDTDAVRRILRVRSRLAAHVAPDGKIELNLEALDPRDAAAIDEAKIRGMLSNQFDARLAHGAHGYAAERGSNALHEPMVSELLRKIRHESRQEDRVALLLKAVLEQRRAAMVLLQLYRDRSRQASGVLDELRHKLAIAERAKDKSDEEVIAELVPRIFTNSHPALRGSSLFALARHLSRWPKINRAISFTTARSNSTYVDPYRVDIDRALRGP